MREYCVYCGKKIEIDQVTAFQGFCQDLEKLDKEALVI